jgi:hypothetical protein
MGGPGGAGACWDESKKPGDQSWDGWAWACQSKVGARWDGWRRTGLNRDGCSRCEERSTGMGWGEGRWNDPDP